MDSLQSSRPYKKAMTRLSALAELTHQADANRLEKRLLYLLVDNEYEELKEKMKNGTLDAKTQEEEKKSIERVEEFLAKTKLIFA
jgi:HD-GYP domain-containing protein (c-di-GMP phosphodiesterase class II)